jgi:hypothetical protein
MELNMHESKKFPTFSEFVPRIEKHLHSDPTLAQTVQQYWCTESQVSRQPSLCELLSYGFHWRQGVSYECDGKRGGCGYMLVSDSLYHRRFEEIPPLLP